MRGEHPILSGKAFWRLTLLLVFVIALSGLTAGEASAGWEEGAAAFKAGQYDEAARHFQQVVDEHQGWPDGHFMLGQALAKLGRKGESLDAFRGAYDLKPDDVRYQLQLSNAYLQNRRYEEAAQLLGRVSRSSVPAGQQATYDRMVATALSKSGDAGGALKAMRQAASSNPQDPALQYSYGVAAFNNGETQAAVSALEKATALDPSDAAKQRALLDALMRYGREQNSTQAKGQVYRKAVTAGRALVSQEASYENFLKLGEAQLGAAEYDEAIVNFNQASTKRPNDWMPHYYIGQAATATEAYDRAESSLSKALEHVEGAENRNKVLGQLGYVYEARDKLDDALDVYTQQGNTTSVARVQSNIDIREHNEKADREEEVFETLKAEEDRIRRELEQLQDPNG